MVLISQAHANSQLLNRVDQKYYTEINYINPQKFRRDKLSDKEVVRNFEKYVRKFFRRNFWGLM